MQVVEDIIGLLFFPGLLFMALCGYILIDLEGRLHVAFYGGTAPRMREVVRNGAVTASLSLGEIVAAVFALAAMGVAGVLLVRARGDLFALVLLLSAIEMLPLFLAAGGGIQETLEIPLLFRRSFVRLGAVFCVAVGLSLRFPGEFAAGLASFRGESVFNAVQLWSGLDFAFILASMVCACLALIVFLCGRPACHDLAGRQGGSAPGNLFMLALEAAERAVTLTFFVILFLGYPWQGWKDLLIWTGAVIGVVAFTISARAWIEGRDRVTLATWQVLALLAALISLALAFAAAA